MVVCELITNIDFIIDYKDRLSPVSECVEGEVFLAPRPAADYRATNQMRDLDKGPMRSQTEIRPGAPGTRPAYNAVSAPDGARNLELSKLASWQVCLQNILLGLHSSLRWSDLNIKMFYVFMVCMYCARYQEHDNVD